jgi:hypothetical protein
LIEFIIKNLPSSPNPFSLGRREQTTFLVPLSLNGRGARGEGFRNFYVTSVIY